MLSYIASFILNFLIKCSTSSLVPEHVQALTLRILYDGVLICTCYAWFHCHTTVVIGSSGDICPKDPVDVFQFDANALDTTASC